MTARWTLPQGAPVKPTPLKTIDRPYTEVLLGKMIISLSMNITMTQLGGASVIAKFHS